MDVNQFVKYVQFHSGLTYRQLAELLTEKRAENIQEILCMQKSEGKR